MVLPAEDKKTSSKLCNGLLQLWFVSGSFRSNRSWCLGIEEIPGGEWRQKSADPLEWRREMHLLCKLGKELNFHMPWNQYHNSFFPHQFLLQFLCFHWRSGYRDQEWSNWFCESHSFSGSSIPAVQQIPSWTLSALSPWREFSSMKSSLFSCGDDFLSEIIHSKSHLWSGFVLFLEDFIEEELEKGSFQSLCVSSTYGCFWWHKLRLWSGQTGRLCWWYMASSIML